MIAKPRTKPKLLALDLDGTLIDKSLRISDRVRDAVHAARAQGVGSAIVTGRMFAAAVPFARVLGIEDAVVCYQGAAIYDPLSGERLQHTPVPHDVAMRALAQAKADGVHPQFYADDVFYVEQLNTYSERYAKLSQQVPVVVPSLEDAFAHKDSTKVVFVMDAADVPAYIERLRALLGDTAYVTRSEPEFVEVLNPQVNKGRALAFIAERLGIELDATLAIGDSYNDLPLLKAAGFGIAMGSAPHDVQSEADAVVADWQGDGVAEAIERYVLQ